MTHLHKYDTLQTIKGHAGQGIWGSTVAQNPDIVTPDVTLQQVNSQRVDMSMAQHMASIIF